MEWYLLRGITNIHSVMVTEVRRYGVLFFSSHDAVRHDNPQQFMEWKMGELDQITNPTNPCNYFMHEHDNQCGVVHWFGNEILERFHVEFWYTHSSLPLLHQDH